MPFCFVAASARAREAVPVPVLSAHDGAQSDDGAAHPNSHRREAVQVRALSYLFLSLTKLRHCQTELVGVD